MGLELGSQISVCHPLQHNIILTDGENPVKDNISHPKVSTFSSEFVFTKDSSDNENETSRHNLNHILNSPSHSESSLCTDYTSNVNLSSDCKEIDVQVVNSNFRMVNYQLDTIHLQSVETDTNLDLHEEEMQTSPDSDGYLEHGCSELEVGFIRTYICSQPTSAKKSTNILHVILETCELGEVRFEFGDGSNSLSIDEFDSNYLTVPDYQLTDVFASEASAYGYMPSVHNHFDMSPISDTIHGDPDLYKDVVLGISDTLKTNSFLPCSHFDSFTTYSAPPSLYPNGHTCSNSGYISGDTFNFSLDKIANNMSSEVGFEIPIYSTNFLKHH